MDPRLSKNHYKIKEASEIIGVPQSTLRYWETEFPELNPCRSKSNQRSYSKTDMELLQVIQFLLHVKGMKIEAVKDQLRHNRKNISKRIEVIEKLKSIRNDLEILLDSLSIRGQKLGLDFSNEEKEPC